MRAPEAKLAAPPFFEDKPMADVPHQGPNLSRMPLEGVGGLIIASLPALCLLISSPAAFAAWVGAGALLAPAIFWWNRRTQGREVGGEGAVTASLALLLAVLIVAAPPIRAAFLPWVAASLAAAALIRWRSESAPQLSIRAY
jgi:hypothetical protein